MRRTTLQVDEATARSIRLAARVWGVSEGDVVRRLVEQVLAGAVDPVSSPTNEPTTPPPSTEAAASGVSSARVTTWMDYAGSRTEALFDLATHEVEITSGPLRGRTFSTPSGACSAVKLHVNPHQTGSCNGWVTWRVADGRTLDRYR